MADSGAGVTGNVLGSQVISIFTEFSGRVGSIRERIKEGIAVKKAEVDNVKREVEMVLNVFMAKHPCNCLLHIVGRAHACFGRPVRPVGR